MFTTFWKQRSDDLMPSAVVLQFTSDEEALTLEPRLEAAALDARNHTRLFALPLRDMAAWLGRHGFRWRPGSSGIWERPA